MPPTVPEGEANALGPDVSVPVVLEPGGVAVVVVVVKIRRKGAGRNEAGRKGVGRKGGTVSCSSLRAPPAQ